MPLAPEKPELLLSLLQKDLKDKISLVEYSVNASVSDSSITSHSSLLPVYFYQDIPVKMFRTVNREAWDTTNDPEIFRWFIGGQLEYRADFLPRIGISGKQPWPSSFWPSYLDCVNVQWAGPTTLSAVQKYAAAFNLSVDLPAAVSNTCGVAAAKSDGEHKLNCSSDFNCSTDGSSVCAKQLVCIPTWEGLCHAWAPAALLEPEPVGEVTQNGQVFKVNDLKALIALCYNSAGSIDVFQVGTRCNANSTEDAGYDNLRRPRRSECRDINAATLFLAATNIIGVAKKSFVFDRVLLDQVFNNPLRGYNVPVYYAISEDSAMQLVGANDTTRDEVFPLSASQYRYAEIVLFFVMETDASIDGNMALTVDWYSASYTIRMVLALDALGNVVAGEYVGDSVWDHPDFMWVPYNMNMATVASSSLDTVSNTLQGVAWANVKSLLNRSVSAS